MFVIFVICNAGKPSVFSHSVMPLINSVVRQVLFSLSISLYRIICVWFMSKINTTQGLSRKYPVIRSNIHASAFLDNNWTGRHCK